MIRFSGKSEKREIGARSKCPGKTKNGASEVSQNWNKNSRVSCRFEVTEESIERDDDSEDE